NIAALRSPGLPSAATRKALAPVWSKLAEAKAAMLAGKYGTSLNAATAAADTAHAIPYDAAESEARLAIGMTLMSLGNAPDAMTALSEGAWAGLRGRRDDMAAQCALYAAMEDSTGLNKDDEARVWLGVGNAIIARTGDHTLQLHALEIGGVVEGHAGDLV